MTTPTTIDSANPFARFATTQSDLTTARDSNMLGQEQFLELMVAQMENQDPSSPQENGEFLAQMAQFSMVSGIGDLERSFNAMAQSMQRNQVASAASLLGRDVLYEGNTAEFVEDGFIKGQVQLDQQVSNVRLQITDSSGVLVDTKDLGTLAAGQTAVRWDGELAGGEPAAPGRYKITAIGVVNGEEQSLPISLFDRVDSVSVDPATRNLSLQLSGGQAIAMSNVLEFK